MVRSQPMAARTSPGRLRNRALRFVVACLWAVVISSHAAAQQGGATAEQSGRTGRTVVLLDVSPLSESGDSRLGDIRMETLRIHLTDVAALVVVEKPASLAATTQARVQAAVALGRTRGAAAVVFIEELGETELRVYWVEPRQGRVWMRPISIGSDGVDAAAETSALIARGGVEELLEAGRMAMEPVSSIPATPKPEPSKNPVIGVLPTRTRPFRFAAGVAYEGTSFASEAAWQSAAGVSVAARLGRSFYVAAKYSFMGPMTIASDSGLRAQLVRRPVELAFGYRQPAPLAWRTELGAFADPVRRSTTGVESGQKPTGELTRVLFGASAKLGVDWEAAHRLRLVGMLGAEAVFNHFDYLADDSQRVVAIHVRRVRPLLVAGVVAELW